MSYLSMAFSILYDKRSFSVVCGVFSVVHYATHEMLVRLTLIISIIISKPIQQ